MLVEDKIYELCTSDIVLINPNILHRNMVSGAHSRINIVFAVKRITILINNILRRKHMNNIFLKNNNLTVEISTLGAEIQSLKKGEKEYIWERKSDIWDGHSPILFPICGKLADNKFIIDGKEFSLNMHGFAKKSVFEIEKSTDTEVIFLLKESSDTLKHYPFHFELRIIYTLKMTVYILSIR